MERDDDHDDALFVKDGAPVKFCFHRSVTQGRHKITRDVLEHGGEIVEDEQDANVLLVDEQEDLEFIRLRYYSSTDLARHRIFVEPRGFVQASIRAGAYHHIRPARQGMPGRKIGNGRRPAVPFTEVDEDHLVFYLATRFPKRDGRMGNKAYQDLERLGGSGDPNWAWAGRHTFNAWRERYKKCRERMDARIDVYQARLKDVGHHYGHERRDHDFRHLRQEEEEGEEEEEEWRRMGRERERVPSAEVLPRPLDRGARQDQGPVRFDEEIEIEDDDEVVIIEPQPAKRPRALPRNDTRVVQTKMARVVNQRFSSAETDRGEGGSGLQEESQEIEGNNLFGDDDEYFDQAPYSPGAAEPSGPPPSSFSTLIPSSPVSAKEVRPAPSRSMQAVEAPARARSPVLTVPNSTQQTLVEEPVAERARATVQFGPSPRQARVIAPAVEVPLRNTRDEDQEDRESIESIEAIDQEEQSETVIMEMLEGSSDEEMIARIPRTQEVELESDPSDTDDAETHESLVRGGVREDSKESASEADEGERMPLVVPRPVARSRAAAQTQTRVSPRPQVGPGAQFSPRRTRSGNRAGTVRR